MASDVCVVFSSEDTSGLFQTALGNLWSQFTAREGKDLIFVSAREKSLTPQLSWDLAVVWDYGGLENLARVASLLRNRMQEAVKQGGFVGVIQHSGSGNNITNQQKALAMGTSWSPASYTHQRGNPLYKAVADVLQTTDADAYQAALRQLLLLVFPPYGFVIDILMAFLPADLAWQVGTLKAADEADRLLLNSVDIFSKYTHLKMRAPVPPAMLDAGEQDIREILLAHLLTKNPHQFHETYIRLRDNLFKIVEAVENRAQD